MFNPNESFTLAVLSKRAGVSAQAAAREAKQLEEWGVVKRGKTVSITIGNTKRVVTGKQKVDTWIANSASKHFRAVSSFVHEVSP